MRLFANTGFLYKDRPFLDRIAQAARDGFDGVEFHDEWRDVPRDDLRAALREAGLPVGGLNAFMGPTSGRAALPGHAAAARADVEEALDAARDLGAGAVHVLAGETEATEDAMAAYRETLVHAADRAAGLTILIEPLCAAAKPVYPLRTVAQAAEIVEAVGRPALRILFDLFHVHGAGDPPVETFRRHADRIGHVQIADPATRHEPKGIGPVLRDLRAAGYGGAFGCEYAPRGDTSAGLGWRSAL